MSNLQRWPNPRHLLGALAGDGVPAELALRIVENYATAVSTYGEDDLSTWRAGILANLPQRPETALALYAYPSEHDRERLEALAATYD